MVARGGGRGGVVRLRRRESRDETHPDVVNAKVMTILCTAPKDKQEWVVMSRNFTVEGAHHKVRSHAVAMWDRTTAMEKLTEQTRRPLVR